MHDLKIYLIPLILIVFIIYRRIKRTIGFQKYSRNKLVLRVIIFSVLATFILSRTILFPVSLLADFLGIVLGVVLLYLAVKNTKFETRADGMYYRTHIWIELTILFLFFGRLIYRLFITFSAIQKMQSGEKFTSPEQNFKDPTTAAIFLILCTYYIGYFSYIIINTKRNALLPGEINSNN